MAKPMEQNVMTGGVSCISAGTVIKGEINTPTDLQIDGTFEGKVYSKGKVKVGEKANIKGDIVCQNVEFCGTIAGNFYVKDTLSLKAGCKVEGDLNVRRLQVELDARFNGNCKMINEAEFDKLAAQITGQPVPQAASQPAQSQQPKTVTPFSQK